MKICRFLAPNKQTPFYGLVTGETVTAFRSNKIFEKDFSLTEEKFALSEIKLLTPIEPSKIVCVGRNYAAHAKELGNEVPTEPLLFFKAPSSLITEGEAIILPSQSSQVEHEGELAAIIGKKAKNIGEEENPLDYVFGYTCLNDVTARDLQRRDVQFARAKSFDTFCPIGAFVETELEPSNLQIVLRVNGVVKQQGNTAQMIFSVPDLIRYISQQMTLLPGDIIATGTPAGVSQLKEGDVCEIEIQGVGVLRNPVAK